MESYFIIDIETCPINLEGYNLLEEEEKLKLINPIDSKIIAIGVRRENQSKIFMEESEEKVLNDFWNEWKRIKQENPNYRVVGFNVLNFDIPFIVSRSFINNIEIVPFVLKSIIDLRDKINAYRYGKSRGKLSDFGKLIGLDISGVDGSKVAEFYKEGKLNEIKKYLEEDLNMTEELFKRAKKTNIINIEKW